MALFDVCVRYTPDMTTARPRIREFVIVSPRYRYDRIAVFLLVANSIRFAEMSRVLSAGCLMTLSGCGGFHYEMRMLERDLPDSYLIPWITLDDSSLSMKSSVIVMLHVFSASGLNPPIPKIALALTVTSLGSP